MTDISCDSIYRDYHEKILSYVLARINNHTEAEDVTSDIFLKIVSSFDSYDSSKGMISTWIYTIANNTMRDYLRKKAVKSKHTAESDDDFLLTLTAPDTNDGEAVFRKELLEVLADALEALNEREQKIIIMHYYCGISHKEISSTLNISYSNVRFINHKAIEAIRSVFKKNNLI